MSSQLSPNRTEEQADIQSSRNESKPSLFSPRPGDDVPLADLPWLAKHARIFIDTTSLLEDGIEQILEVDLLEQLEAAGARLNVLSRSIDHLQQNTQNDDIASREKAVRALACLSRLQKRNAIRDLSDPRDVPGNPFATAAIFGEMFIRYQLEAVQCLITQDESLALQVIRNSRLDALEHSKPTIGLYLDNGQLKNWVPRLMSLENKQGQSGSGRETIEKSVSRKHKIVADTSALMFQDDSGNPRGKDFFLQILLPLLRETKNPLIVPMRVLRELQKHTLSSDVNRAASSRAAVEVLDIYARENLLIRGEDQDEVKGTNTRFADPVFLQLEVRFQDTHRICFITQDTELARSLIYNRQQGNEQRVNVTFIAMWGNLKLLHWEPRLAKDGQRDSNKKNTKQRPASAAKYDSDPQNKTDDRGSRKNEQEIGKDRKPQSARPKLQPFTTQIEPISLQSRSLSVAKLPAEGDVVHGRKAGKIILGTTIAAGGEGTIFATQADNLVCKIYHQECLTQHRKDKLELMLSRDVAINGVCWPTDIVCTDEGEFVGYLMPRSEGKMLKTSVFAKPLLKKNFPNWSREQLIQLAVTLLRAIERLHRLNVYIGDINPQNVLVKDENNISIVDMDSVQVEGFPCPVGTDTFTPAQRQGMNYADFLRTRDDELFAVTTLLFMIIFPGNAPYTSQGGGEAAENIRNHRFAYGRDADGRPPVGAWQFIWSHLHPALKDDFIKVFKDDGRVPIGELIKHLLWYQNEIREGKRSGDIFPDKPRMKEGDTELVQCDSCPSDRPLHEVSKTLAEKLRLEGRAFRCSHCAALRKISRLEQTREVECTLRLSPQCAGKTVAQSSYLDMLRQKGQDFWCKPCSEAMRLQRQSGQRYRRRDNYSAGSSYGSKSNSPCFVATATYQSDSAPQVVFLRAYRDQVLRRTLAGRAFIEIYYRLGPLLAKPVQRSPRLRAISRRALDALVNQLIRNRSNWKLD